MELYTWHSCTPLGISPYLLTKPFDYCFKDEENGTQNLSLHEDKDEGR
jgi:hypothetical protein